MATAVIFYDGMNMNYRTRIKICGLTRAEDVQAAVDAGADALGFVFYPASPRALSAEAAAELMAALPPFVQTVGLFVNATPEQVAAAMAIAPVSLLQFHGDESAAYCAAVAERANRPFLRAFRVRPDTTANDLLEYDTVMRTASRKFSALLLDTYVDSFGGSGKVFDWSLIPEKLAPRVVLSGGLSVQNATDAVRRVRPWAVDVSSGVELAKGLKDHAKMRHFVQAVRMADQEIGPSSNG